MKKIIIALSLLVVFSPAFVFAQPRQVIVGNDFVQTQGRLATVTNANSLIMKISNLMDSVVWVLVSLAVLFVVWNAVQFVRYGGDSEKRKEYQGAIMWGIVGLAVILSIWGLVYIVRNTVGVDNYGGETDAYKNVNSLLLKNPTPTQ